MLIFKSLTTWGPDYNRPVTERTRGALLQDRNWNILMFVHVKPELNCYTQDRTHSSWQAHIKILIIVCSVFLTVSSSGLERTGTWKHSVWSLFTCRSMWHICWGLLGGDVGNNMPAVIWGGDWSVWLVWSDLMNWCLMHGCSYYIQSELG